jgi:Fe2+ or Zn2+ uptake regulation protein
MPKPGKITLESDASHFYCAGCGNIKPVKQGVYKGLVAYSNGDHADSSHYVAWKLLCKECYTGKKEEIKDKKVKGK